MHEVKHLHLTFYLPEGLKLTAARRDLYLPHQEGREAVWEAVVTAEGPVGPVNRILVEAAADGHPVAGYIPITIIG